MATEIKPKFLVIESDGLPINLMAQDDSILAWNLAYTEQDPMEGIFNFSISKEDWPIIRAFIDEQFKTAK